MAQKKNYPLGWKDSIRAYLTEFKEIWSDNIFEVDRNQLFLVDLSFTSLNRYIKSNRSFFDKTWKEIENVSKTQLDIELYISDIAILIQTLMYELLLTYFLKTKKIKLKISLKARRAFAYVAMSYKNTLFSLMESQKNYLEGKILIGEVLFRHYMELMISNILVLVNEDYFKIVLTYPKTDKEARQKWAKTNPSAVRKQFNAYINTYFNENDMDKEFANFRDIVYNSHSKSAHGEVSAQFKSAYGKKNMEGDKLFDVFEPDIDQQKYNFEEYIIFNYYIIFILFTAFVSFHKLPMKHFSTLGKEIGYLFNFYETLMRKYLKEKIGMKQ